MRATQRNPLKVFDHDSTISRKALKKQQLGAQTWGQSEDRFVVSSTQTFTVERKDVEVTLVSRHPLLWFECIPRFLYVEDVDSQDDGICR